MKNLVEEKPHFYEEDKEANLSYVPKGETNPLILNLMDNLTKDLIEEVSPRNDGDQIVAEDMFEGGLINHMEVEGIQLEVSRPPKGSTYYEDPILPNSLDYQFEELA
eukprot:Gb_41762 [translate_table: standard]